MIFSVGKEVDNTICKGKNTLFVSGWQPKEEILARALNQNTNFIHFTDFSPKLGKQFNLWEKLLKDLLKVKDLFLTLEFEPRYCRDIINMELNKNDNFVPILIFNIPDVHEFNSNSVFKITDKWFAGSNAGMWTASLKTIFKKTYLTGWNKYLERQEIL